MIILCPSRGRPDRALEMATSARLTAADPDALEVMIIVDRTDPALPEYEGRFHADPSRPTWLRVLEERTRYVPALNIGAAESLERHAILGAFGDDVLFRTQGWDRIIVEALSTPGIAYGDDGIHGEAHPSAVFMSRELVLALGWLALPATDHQWADDGWKALGQALGCLRYCGAVLLEHMHPAVGKAPWDAGYRELLGTKGEEPDVDAEALERATHDYNGFTVWAREALPADVARVRAYLEP